MWITLCLTFFQIAGFIASIHAIMETRTAQGTIAWAVALNTIPYLAVPAYIVFGRSKFAGYVHSRRGQTLNENPTAKKLVKEMEEFRLRLDTREHETRLLESLAKMPFTSNNRAELLIDGEATFNAIFAAIESATDYVLVQFYIIREDDLGKRLTDLLLKKAAEGVRCYVLFDEIGSGRLRGYCRKMRAHGVQIAPFDTTKGFTNRFQINFRNHRKIVIADGRIAFVGGLNVGDEYLGKDPRFGPWRDTHVEVEGPVVQEVQVSWFEDWKWATDETPKLNWSPQRSPSNNTAALCLTTGPADTLETATLFFLFAINAAQERLWIASPYFVPDEQFISALQLAALRGVDVRILIPEKPDNRLVRLSSFSYLDETVPLGIKWYRHQKGFMHQKVMLVDQDYCAIGTANFDNRSFRLNFEITMGFADKVMAGKVEAMLENDLANSRIVEQKEIREASFLFRLCVRVARLLAPIQ
ncbi:MAG TPA: cardiolipin synthase [Chthoniobacterales bacterium]|jgi:cardiolipin synthase